MQDNQSVSKKGVVRGLHAQTAPNVQAKLVRVIYGRIFDVAVDLRRDSNSFGKWVGCYIDSTRKSKTKKLDSNFWDDVSKGVAENDAKSDEICAAGNCSKPVSAFDFRCFQCRGRFCADCESGKSIMCKSCS